MKKINFLSFNKMNIDNIGTSLDCIEMPMAYAASRYKTEYFYYYIIDSFINRVWPDENKGNTFAEDNNLFLNELGIQIHPIEFRTKEVIIDEIKKSIDVGNPVYLLFDYYEMFYEETYYKKQHIPHGVVLSGYDDERKLFVIQEGAHMNFTALYPLLLTYDMVWTILNKSREFFKKRKYFESPIYAFDVIDNTNSEFLLIDYIQKMLNKIKNNKNSLAEEIRSFDADCLKPLYGPGDFRRRFCASQVVFFDFVERILKAEGYDFTQRYDCFKKECLKFYDTFTSNIIVKHMRGEKVQIDNISECLKKINELDMELYEVVSEIIANKK